MLIEKLNSLDIEKLQKIYNLLWEGAKQFKKIDLVEHIKRYIVLFYNMRKFKSSCRNKARILINAIKTI